MWQVAFQDQNIKMKRHKGIQTDYVYFIKGNEEEK